MYKIQRTSNLMLTNKYVYGEHKYTYDFMNIEINKAMVQRFIIKNILLT